jgi:DNA replication protein DnaC
MSTPQLERLQAHCQRLRLYQVAAELPSLLEQAAKAERSYTDFLEAPSSIPREGTNNTLSVAPS